MPTNALRVQRSEDGSFQVDVWGPDGVKRDLTPHFQQITGPEAPSLFLHKIRLKNTTFATQVEFTPNEMDLQFHLDEDVARQLAAIPL